MQKTKVGDIVRNNEYNSDVIFKIISIDNINKVKIARLKGLNKRLEILGKVEQIEKLDRKIINVLLKKRDENFVECEQNRYINEKEFKLAGRILHLDGDKKYSQKADRYYKKLGLEAIVRNIPEYRQPQIILKLLQIYEPDILIITGHDSMLKRNVDYYNIYNYKNSKYFIETVKKAREFDKRYGKTTVIFAGACESYFEAIISAGANFASSPARILIDFLDPIVVAQKIALTELYKYVTINDIVDELRDGTKGVNGIGAKGKMKLR